MDPLTLPKAKVDFAYTPVINFALQQNHVPVIRELVIINHSAEDWQQVTITLTTEPVFAAVWTHTTEVIKKGGSCSFKNIPLQLSAGFLVELTERIAGKLLLTVNAGDQLLYTAYYAIDLLPFDQWSGVAVLPEMLAAFITPNHPEIPAIIRSAAGILQKWTGSPSFDEYQSRNPDRVRKQMAAIYEAISERQLVYCTVPTSFEESGQRVRLADNIFTNQLANCLDLSLLYAACLEAVGIHPLLVIVKGHAFAGGWLINESFADAVNDDPSLITKRTVDGINEIAVVEATCMNAGNHISFDEAAKSADKRMLATKEFILFIDVKRARFSGIRPLPLRVPTATGWRVEEDARAERNNVLPEDIYVGSQLLHADSIDVSKQQLWERKLLDLTLRNSLLNIRITKSVIQFITISTSKLEDALANGEEFEVLSKPTDWDNPLRDTGVYQALHQSDPIADLVHHELAHKRIRTYLSEAELNYSLTSLYRASRLSLEENGANTLYIGIGLLKWYETAASERPRYAPVLLVPVEIIRKSARKGFVIRSREEETIVNITLLEMIRQDFGIAVSGLDVLPKDENGIDVRQVFNIVRQAIMAQPRWDVEEQAILGTFSFSKFILWNDIHHNADVLCKHKVVSSLVSGRLEWQTADMATLAAITDEQLHPSRIALPISTDASQLQAIVSSGQDQSFVLHGPPGTGKSQTITNIIANALYAGKRVLFVAAKKAALDVVESRLESIGIGAFCLELHSNKSKKSAVLEQLKQATEVAYKAAPGNFQLEADRLYALRNELNTYVEALHKKHSSGYSLFELFTGYSHLPEGADNVYFPANSIEALTPARLTSWQDIAEQLQTVGLLIGHPHQHPLSAIHITSYTPQLKQDAKTAIESLLTTLQQLAQQQAALCTVLKLNDSITTQAQEEALETLARLLLQLGDIPASMFSTDAPEQTMAQVAGIAAHGKQRDILRTQLLNQFQKGILTFPAEQTLAQWNMAAEKWFLPRWLAQRKLLKSIKLLTTSGTPDKDSIADTLQQVIAFQQEQELIDKASYLPVLLGFLWQNGDPDWNSILQTSHTLQQINRVAGTITGTGNTRDWRHRMAEAFGDGSKLYIDTHISAFTSYLDTRQQLSTLQATLERLLGIHFSTLLTANGSPLQELHAVATGWLQHIEELKDWHHWVNTSNQALEAGLQPFMAVYMHGDIQSNEVVQQYQKGLYRSIAEYLIERNPQLAAFNSMLFEEKIRKFRDVSKRFEALTREELYARLASQVPSFTQEASQSSEIGMLQKAIRNNGRAMSIRKIFDSIPNLLPRLTPCMLMSPISVSQYFDANSPKFDLVIFDEASQMPTCEAVGAIARGNNVIIVGDPKQMPPTRFFATSNVDEENIEQEDLESILDDCLALSMPSQHLLWHYRSKHESLIAFSNASYYENKLLTFPSTDDITSKVQFIPVEGYYDKGKTRQNRFEAKAIVDEVVYRLSTPELRHQSIGIVTFSAAQQLLIDDLLTEVFKTRPDLEKAALETAEPVFIKNLENVQGDERDVILFSIGYGPDQDGKVSLNFGPVNREGGWRRLNVAVSRARHEMKVFSTLRADQIDVNRTSSEGVAGLKAFLAYAEKGKTTLPLPTSQQPASEENSFENLIAAALRKQGYEVHTHIGCSAYKIDIAIVDKDNKDRYLLGILTDGKNYYNARTSKDREITQVEVLNTLGWNIHKIWSTEWWEKPAKVMGGIIEAIRLAEAQKARPIPATIRTLAPEPSEPALQATFNNTAVGSGPAAVALPRPVITSSAIPYEMARPDAVLSTSAEDFLMPHHAEKIKTQIALVLDKESPISKTLLTKRLLTAWGINRLGTRVSSYLDTLFAQSAMTSVVYKKNTFFWKQEQAPDSYAVYRVSSQEAQKREADELPPEEIANGVKEVLKNQLSLSKADLVKETARLFGYARIGGNVEEAMLLGIDLAVERGDAYIENERVIYAN